MSFRLIVNGERVWEGSSLFLLLVAFVKLAPKQGDRIEIWMRARTKFYSIAQGVWGASE